MSIIEEIEWFEQQWCKQSCKLAWKCFLDEFVSWACLNRILGKEHDVRDFWCNSVKYEVYEANCYSIMIMLIIMSWEDHQCCMSLAGQLLGPYTLVVSSWVNKLWIASPQPALVALTSVVHIRWANCVSIITRLFVDTIYWRCDSIFTTIAAA